MTAGLRWSPNIGIAWEIRTPDTVVRSHALCPAELKRHIWSMLAILTPNIHQLSSFYNLKASELSVGGVMDTMVPQEGLKPPTDRVEAGCSIQLSYWGISRFGKII